MKASQYAALFDSFSTREDFNNYEKVKEPFTKLMHGLLDEMSVRDPHSMLSDAAQIRKATLEANHKFRVVRGMLKTRLGFAPLAYDGFAKWFLKEFKDLLSDLPGIERELMQ